MKQLNTQMMRPRLTTWLVALCMVGSAAQAQINYSEGFTGCDAASCNGWTMGGEGFSSSITATSGDNYSPCSSSNPAAKSNIYGGGSNNDAYLEATASLGTSSGLLATFGFDYKCVNYSNGAATNAGRATFTVEWGTAPGGPWTTAGTTFNNISSSSCTAAPARTFTPPAGQPIFVRIHAHRNTGDFWVVMDNLTLTQGINAPCSGTPAPGTTTSTNATPCAGANFTLAVQNATSGTGVTYQWQSSTTGASGPFANNGLGTAATQVTNAAVPTWYRLNVTCSGNTGTSTPVLITPTLSAACYCTVSSNTFDDGTGVTNVTFNTINNSSLGDPEYTNYSAQSTSVAAGSDHTLAVRVNTAGNFTAYASAWIDWDQSGTFDAGEAYDLGSVTNVADGAPSGSPVTVTVPLTAVPGNTIMRVRATYDEAANACGDQNYSEAEDYTINVIGCSGPTPTATATSDAPACVGEGVQLTGGSDVGTSFSWTGPDGFTSTAQNPVIADATLADAGTYTLVVNTGAGTCNSAPATTVVSVFAPPTAVTANASLATVCAGSTVDLTSSADGSTVVLTEDFEGTVPGWTVENLSTGGNPAAAAWTLYTSGGGVSSNDNSIFAGANSDAQGSGSTTNTSLISPVFSLAGLSSASLNFHHYLRFVGNEIANVQVSTDGTTWTTLQSYAAETGVPEGFTPATISLDAYAGQASVQVRFEYLATWDWYWLVDNISVSGTAIVSYAWNSSPAGFTSSDQNPTGVVVNYNTTYTVSASAFGCASTAEVSVATVTPPNAGTDGSLALCSSSAATNLFDQLGNNPEPGGTWSGPGGAHDGSFDPALDAAGNYIYTVTGTAPCANDQSQVAVSITPAANAGVDAVLTTCDQGASTDLHTILGGSPDFGGSWSGPSSITGGMYDPSTMLPGAYVYTMNGTAPCGPMQATVTVNETASPDAGTDGALSACNGGAATNLLAELGGTPDAGGTWSGPSPVVNDLYDPASMTPGAYVYTVAATAPCTGDASATVNVAETGNQVVVRINTDNNADQITWAIRDAGNAIIASGGPAPGQDNTQVDETVCLSALAGNCYTLQLFDSFGDGITSGGWQLRTAGGGLILQDAFATGSQSPSATPQWSGYGSGHPFCLPLGPANIASTECGIFTNGPGNKVYSTKVTGASLYQFEFTDPDAGYTRRQARPTNRIHFWDLDPYPLTPGVVYFARVRTNVSGPLSEAHFGTGCEMGLAVQVPCTELISAPNYGHSCNETREFGRYGFIYAIPVAGADAYEFRVYNLGEGYDQTFTRSTYILHLKWPASEAPGLTNGSTYNVDVNVIMNGVESGFCGTTCTVTIQNAANFAGQLEQTTFGDATLWPNPVRDGLVHLNIEGLSAGSPSDDPAVTDQQITVEVQDLYGKQVYAKTFSNSGESFSTVLQLPSSIASGVYMVNITADGKRTVQRLSIIR